MTPSEETMSEFYWIFWMLAGSLFVESWGRAIAARSGNRDEGRAECGCPAPAECRC